MWCSYCFVYSFICYFLLDGSIQVEFIQKFPPQEEENWPVWQHISFQAFSVELRKAAALELVRAGILRCREWLSSSRTYTELKALVCGAALTASLLGWSVGVWSSQDEHSLHHCGAELRVVSWGTNGTDSLSSLEQSPVFSLCYRKKVCENFLWTCGCCFGETGSSVHCGDHLECLGSDLGWLHASQGPPTVLAPP